MYMSDIGRWGVVDPLAEKYPGLAPYNFVANSPVNVTDKDGRDWEWNWTRDKDGNINGLNLTLNGKILDRTGTYSNKQLNALKDKYVKGIQSMLKGSFGKDFKISTSANLSIANVYKVKVIDTSDTIYVLEVCQRMIWVANSKLDAESRYPFIIEPSLKNIIEVLIPGNVRIPLGQNSYLVVLNVLSTKDPASYAWPCVPLENQTNPGA